MDKHNQRVLLIENTSQAASQIYTLLRDLKDFQVDMQTLEQTHHTPLVVDSEGLGAILLDTATINEQDLEFLQILRDALPQLPILLFTDEENETFASQVLHSGAQDYLPKSLLNKPLLSRAISNAIERQRRCMTFRQKNQELEAHQTQFNTLIERNADGILIVDQKGVIRFANPAAERLFDTPVSELIGKDFGFPIQADDTIEIDIWKHGGERFAEMRVGDTIWHGESVFLVSLRDATERVQAEKQMRYLATHDALTNLPNRILFFDRLKQALARARRYHGVLAILFLDIDHFKQINDEYGHATGDQILKTVAFRLEECMRKSDTVARMGGDEFTIILESISTPNDCIAVAEKLLEVVGIPFSVKKQEFHLSLSIGISLYPKDGEDGDVLVNHADTAMYIAKQSRNHYHFYSLTPTA
ncbi:MAG TPA: diguanylate cyclase [Anaerolineales bacterium]|nr:diguanylate cyclase [Anaerolineales bacterium]